MKKLFLALTACIVMLVNSLAIATTVTVADLGYYDPVESYDLTQIAFTEQAPAANTMKDDKFLSTGDVSLEMPKHGMTWVRSGTDKIAGIRAPFTAFKAVYKPDYVPIKMPIPV